VPYTCRLLADLRERAARAEGEAATLRDGLAQERERADRAEAEAQIERNRAAAAETHGRELAFSLSRQSERAGQAEAEVRAPKERMEAAEKARDAAHREHDDMRGELEAWMRGGRLTRALRAFLSRRQT
jgi:chromosome segregation ATPase